MKISKSSIECQIKLQFLRNIWMVPFQIKCLHLPWKKTEVLHHPLQTSLLLQSICRKVLLSDHTEEKCRNFSISKFVRRLLKYGFCNKSFRKDEPLTSWTLLKHNHPHFWAWLLNTIAITPKSEDKYAVKVFNWSEVHLSEMTFYKIHTLVTISKALDIEFICSMGH